MIALFSAHTAMSCDVCGGAVGSVSGTVIPGTFDNYIGLNTSFQWFSSTHLTLFENEVPIHSRELFSLGSIHGRYSPVRRVQFLVNVPLSRVQKQMDGEKNIISGVSDISIRTNYLIVDRNKEEEKKYLNLFVGGSVKVPTGRSVFRGEELSVFHRNMLPGTGTFDFGLHADVFFRKRSNGFTGRNTVTFRGAIPNEYDYGNVFQSRWSGFHMFEFKKTSLMLDLGAEMLLLGKDENWAIGETDRYTGGWTLSPSLRVIYFWKNVVLNAKFQRPAVQNLASGQVKNTFSLQGGIILLLKKSKE